MFKDFGIFACFAFVCMFTVKNLKLELALNGTV